MAYCLSVNKGVLVRQRNVFVIVYGLKTKLKGQLRESRSDDRSLNVTALTGAEWSCSRSGRLSGNSSPNTNTCLNRRSAGFVALLIFLWSAAVHDGRRHQQKEWGEWKWSRLICQRCRSIYALILLFLRCRRELKRLKMWKRALCKWFTNDFRL